MPSHAEQVDRVAALCKAFGWQGGTIHQLASETGCSVDSLLNTEKNEYSPDYSSGWFAYRTCSLEHNQKHSPGNRENVQFWIGVSGGVLCSIKQGMETPKRF